MEHPIQGVMNTTMENLKSMIDVDTVVGSSVVMADGTMIIPVSKVSLGFLSGGGEYPASEGKKVQGGQQGGAQNASGGQAGQSAQGKEVFPFAGGAGAGVSVNPVAFLVAGAGKVQLLPIDCSTPYERIIDMVPGLICDIKEVIQTKCREKNEQAEKSEWEILDEDFEQP